EGLPYFKVAGIFGKHAFRVKLKPGHEGHFGIVEAFDQSIIGQGHWLEARRQFANALMVIAVDVEFLAAIPPGKRSARKDRDGMPVTVVVSIIDVRSLRSLFYLDVAV